MFLLKNAHENAMSHHFSSFSLLLAAFALLLVFSPFTQDEEAVGFCVPLLSIFLWEG